MLADTERARDALPSIPPDLPRDEWVRAGMAAQAAAVVCFGWGRVRAVAAELRERDASAWLVLVPDVGKEQNADNRTSRTRDAITGLVSRGLLGCSEGWLWLK